MVGFGVPWRGWRVRGLSDVCVACPGWVDVVLVGVEWFGWPGMYGCALVWFAMAFVIGLVCPSVGWFALVFVGVDWLMWVCAGLCY